MANEERTRPTPPKSAPVGPPSRRKKSNRRFISTILIFLLITGLVFFAIKYYQTRKEADNLSNPQTAAAQQTTDLVNKVSKLVELPTGQTPTVATVTDINKLKGQAFFMAAHNGDKVLIYTQSKKAILYRPS